MKKSSNQITISDFLERYLGIENKNLSRLTHKDVKELFPYLKRVPFDFVDYNDDTQIIEVKDSKGNIVPYIRPDVDVFKSPTHVDIDTDTIKEDEEIDMDSLDNYSLYELNNALNQTKKISELKKIKATIYSKSDRRRKPKQEYSRKFNKNLEKDDEYDKHKRR